MSKSDFRQAEIYLKIITPLIIVKRDSPNSPEALFEGIQYLEVKNLTNVYDFLYSIARVTCSCGDPFMRNCLQFVGHLIRYGRICQVCNH